MRLLQDTLLSRSLRAHWALLVLLCGALGACIDERPELSDQQKYTDGDVALHLTFTLPAGTEVKGTSTRAAGDTENTVSTMLLYVVDADGSTVTEGPLDPQSSISVVAGKENTYSARYKVKPSATASKIYLVANYGDTKPTNFSTVAELEAYTSGVLTGESSPGFPLLMGGKHDISGITEGMQIETVSLIRASARIKVVKDENNQLNGKFNLERFYLAQGWDRGTAFGTPNIPTKPTDVQTLAKSSSSGSNQWLYCYERANNSINDCAYIIIEGTYEGKKCYYRLDFFDKTKGKHIPILRNHAYTIHIKEVTKAGYSENEAIKYPHGVELEFDITDDGIVNIVGNGFFVLGLSESEIIWGGNEKAVNIARMETNYPIATSGSATLSGTIPVEASGKEAGNTPIYFALENPADNWIKSVSYTVPQDAISNPQGEHANAKTFLLSVTVDWKTGFTANRKGKLKVKIGDLERTLEISQNLNTFITKNIFVNYEKDLTSETEIHTLHPVDESFNLKRENITVNPIPVQDESTKETILLTDQLNFLGVKFDDKIKDEQGNKIPIAQVRTVKRNNNGTLSLEAEVTLNNGSGFVSGSKLKVVQSHFPDGIWYDGVIGIYRSNDDNTPYELEFGNMYGDFTVSVSPGDEGWIKLGGFEEPPTQSLIRGSAPRWDGYDKPRDGKYSKVRFRYKLENNPNSSQDRLGYIMLKYNNNQCQHKILVHQGFGDIEWQGWTAGGRKVDKYIWLYANCTNTYDLANKTMKPENPGKMYLFQNSNLAYFNPHKGNETIKSFKWGVAEETSASVIITQFDGRYHDKEQNINTGNTHATGWELRKNQPNYVYGSQGWGRKPTPSYGGTVDVDDQTGKGPCPEGYRVPRREELLYSFWIPAGINPNTNTNPNGSINATTKQQCIWGRINDYKAKTWEQMVADGRDKNRPGMLFIDHTTPNDPKTIFFPGGGRRSGLDGKLDYCSPSMRKGDKARKTEWRYSYEGAVYFAGDLFNNRIHGMNIYHDPWHEIGCQQERPLSILGDDMDAPVFADLSTSGGELGGLSPMTDNGWERDKQSNRSRFTQEAWFVRGIKKGKYNIPKSQN